MAFNTAFTAVGDGGIDMFGATEVGVNWQLAFTAGSTYVTGGLALTAAQFGLSRPIAYVLFAAYNTAAIVAPAIWNFQTSKMMLLGTTAGAAGTAPYQDLTNGTAIAGFGYLLQVVTQR
jgi:hypothetical protein